MWICGTHLKDPWFQCIIHQNIVAVKLKAMLVLNNDVLNCQKWPQDEHMDLVEEGIYFLFSMLRYHVHLKAVQGPASMTLLRSNQWFQVFFRSMHDYFHYLSHMWKRALDITDHLVPVFDLKVGACFWMEKLVRCTKLLTMSSFFTVKWAIVNLANPDLYTYACLRSTYKVSGALCGENKLNQHLKFSYASNSAMLRWGKNYLEWSVGKNTHVEAEIKFLSTY